MLCAMDRVDAARCIRRTRLPESRGSRTGSAGALGRRGCLADVPWRRRGDRSSRTHRRRQRGRRGARRRSTRLAGRARRRCCDGPGGRPASLPSLPPQSVRCQPCRLRCRRSGPVWVQAPRHGGPAPARCLPCRRNPCRGAAGDERKPVVAHGTLTPIARCASKSLGPWRAEYRTALRGNALRKDRRRDERVGRYGLLGASRVEALVTRDLRYEHHVGARADQVGRERNAQHVCRQLRHIGHARGGELREPEPSVEEGRERAFGPCSASASQVTKPRNLGQVGLSRPRGEGLAKQPAGVRGQQSVGIHARQVEVPSWTSKAAVPTPLTSL